jgi:hypothetical protein
MILLGVWLILTGLQSLVALTLPGGNALLALLAIAAGIVLIIEVRQMPSRNLGRLLLAIWLILMGLFPLLNLSFQGQAQVMAILAAAAGVLLLIGR